MAKSGNGRKWRAGQTPSFPPHIHTVHTSHARQTPVIPRAMALPSPSPTYTHNFCSILYLDSREMRVSTSTSELPTKAGV